MHPLSKILCLLFSLGLVLQAGDSDYTKFKALRYGFNGLSINGQIDLTRWENWNFPFCEPLTIRDADNISRRFEPIFDRYFEVGTQKRIDELTERYKQQADVSSELTIKNKLVYYKNRKLNYSQRVYQPGTPWWRGGDPLDDGPHAFRFGSYLIFKVQARAYFKLNNYDMVLYNLNTDDFAIHKTDGGWSIVWLFEESEVVPDPRQK